MIIFNKNKLLSSESNCIGVVGDNKVYTQEFYIKGIADNSINYTLHLRFADGSVNSVIPDITRVDRDSTTLRWIVKKNDIYVHGYFEVQIEGINSTGLVFQTEIVKMYADESIPIEDKEFVNLNSENLKLREEAYEMVKKLDDFSEVLEETDITSIESTNNKVTSFASNFEDTDNKKYPTITALIKYLKDYYYDLSDIDDMVESMHIDDEGNLSVTLPFWNGEEGETLIIGKVSGKDGVDGKDGVGIASTTIETTALDGGTNAITFNLTNGKSTTLPVKNGSKGSQGDKGEQGVQGATGPQGEKGETGADGYTPVKGTDYWTEEDKAEIMSDANELISSKLADLTQIEPRFVNSVDECVDTSKVYVLPDGYIYSYSKSKIKDEVVIISDAIGTSTDENGDVFNGTGYINGYRISSSGSYSPSGASAVSGFIPFAVGDILQGHVGLMTTDYDWDGDGSVSSSERSNYCAIALYDADKKWLKTHYIADWDGVNCYVDDTEFIYEPSECGFGNYAYARIVSYHLIREEVYVLVSRVDTIEAYSWSNTGILFVQGDNEARVVALEDTTTDHETRLDKLEISGVEVTDSIPEYVKNEADRVATNVISHQNENTVTFIVCSDAHHSVVNTSMSTQMDESIKHCGQGMRLIRDKVHIDFAAMLGDVVWEYTESKEDVFNAYRTFNSYIADAFEGVQNFRTKGNHDCMSIAPPRLSESQTFANIGIYNSGAVYDSTNKASGYCYKDFEEFKIRVVCLNTSEGQNCNFNITDTQIAWLETALDISSLGDGWSTVLLSHHPLDWGGNNTDVMATIKNANNILCAFHGHVHGFKVDNMGDTQIKRIAIPNACYYRNNEYGQNGTTENADGTEFGEETTYSKIANSAQDTAFCVVTIDLANKKVYADHYGAGYDREIVC